MAIKHHVLQLKVNLFPAISTPVTHIVSRELNFRKCGAGTVTIPSYLEDHTKEFLSHASDL